MAFIASLFCSKKAFYPGIGNQFKCRDGYDNSLNPNSCVLCFFPLFGLLLSRSLKTLPSDLLPSSRLS